MRIIPFKEMPLIDEGDNIEELILQSAEEQEVKIEDKDVIVIAQTIVSKAEGEVLNLGDIEPSKEAIEISKKINQNPKIVEIILEETNEKIKIGESLIVETKHGFICANAGVDTSNVEKGKVTVLPKNPDKSAKRIKRKIEKKTQSEISVIISDSQGRPFRLGAIGFAVGLAGIKPINDLRGHQDAYDKRLENTKTAPPDALAAAASLKMGEKDEKIPSVLIKDAPYEMGKGKASDITRDKEKDLFR